MDAIALNRDDLFAPEASFGANVLGADRHVENPHYYAPSSNTLSIPPTIYLAFHALERFSEASQEKRRLSSALYRVLDLLG